MTRGTGAILAGGLLLIWPALANGYPLVFTDTGAFLDQLLRPFMVWDKPWIYGPVLAVLSLRLTLWLPMLAQGLAVSWVLWRVHRVFRVPSPLSHLGLCLALALGSAAPWFAALLMPDILAPLTVLTLFPLAFEPAGTRRWSLTALAAFAIAAHLTHLPIAAACLAVVGIARPRALPRAALPLGLALSMLMAANLAGHGRLGVSPFGSVFALARLVTDGPGRDYLRDHCPDASPWLCGWTSRFPATSDLFLWSPDGPVWSFPGGPIALAPEAARIVTATILTRPGAVAWTALRNTADQFLMARIDTVLRGADLDATVGARLRAYYPEDEVARFQAGAQHAGRLSVLAAPWQAVQGVFLVAGAISAVVLLAWSWRHDRVLCALIALIAAGISGNAFATGALSGPADRYQARVAWLLVLPVLLVGVRGDRAMLWRAPSNEIRTAKTGARRSKSAYWRAWMA